MSGREPSGWPRRCETEAPITISIMCIIIINRSSSNSSSSSSSSTTTTTTTTPIIIIIIIITIIIIIAPARGTWRTPGSWHPPPGIGICNIIWYNISIIHNNVMYSL